ncbi:amidohydrolase family protein [Nocardia sp. alder85J]|uniref:amidohydrolase family protein n=1 Tax=Nocardia sp. alder85J TaxID=2862949 RepID=UPI001CD7BAE0|nr:amidohydrolase family protein [Nocardia sp. alder85J]MCX4091593.1 amidohydrolase family protein [Nocardia sp. alder85J]
MAMPTGVPIVDTMIGFPHEGSAQYDFIRKQTRDQGSAKMEFPAEYMFKNVPKQLPTDDPVSVTLHEMDRFGIEVGMIGVADQTSQLALKRHPDRFVASSSIDDPNDVTGSVRRLRREYEEFGVRAAGVFPAGTFPQVAIDDPKMYPVYQTCVDLGIPIFCTAGIPGPRLKYAVQEVSRIDVVMYDFPELVFVTRHGCEPWEDLAVKLMLKWPNLYYSTSAFAPKYYPKSIVDYANSRGADKILYGGYFPMGLSLERIFRDMPHVAFKDEVWPKFLGGTARRLLKLDQPTGSHPASAS